MNSTRPDCPRPENYVRGYTPRGDAQLAIHVVDERPRLRPRDIARSLRNAVLAVCGDLNDIRAEQAWRAMRRRWGAVTPEVIEQYLAERWAGDFLRKLEYPFLCRCLAGLDPAPRVIVDMGGGYSFSTVVPMLLRLPEAQVLSVDVTHHRRRSKYGVRYVRGDCMRTGLPDASADVVALISTLEHVGLGRYGDPLDVDGDIKTMREAHRILKPGGCVILTVPYGYPTVVFNLHRIYDEGRFGMLSAEFTPVVEEYTLFGKPATREEAEAQLPARYTRLVGGVMALLKKLEG